MSSTFAHAIHQARCALPGETPLHSCSEPCVVMIRREGKNLRFSLAYTVLGNSIPQDQKLEIELVIQGTWGLSAGDGRVSRRIEGQQTKLAVRPTSNMAVEWEMKPL